MKTIIVSNEYYSIIDLTLEYKNWTGQEKYAVISSLEQGYIETTFAKELKAYIYLSIRTLKPMFRLSGINSMSGGKDYERR